MTPERQKWWDSLPAEEKRVREDIDEFKRMIKHNKKHLIPYIAFAKYHMRYSKKALKALRKQIAMRPIVFKYPGYKSYECPRCREGAITYLPHCSMCGQKLRWKECVD